MRASQAFNAGSIPVTRSNRSIFRYLTGIEPVRAVEVKNVRWTFFTSTGVVLLFCKPVTTGAAKVTKQVTEVS